MESRIIDVRGDDSGLYATFCEWWASHGWPSMAVGILPRCGILIKGEDGRGLAVGWLYMSNDNGVSMLEWVVTNPANSPRESISALKQLIDSARITAAGMDYGVMLTAVKQPSLVRLYEREGFTKTDVGMTHMVLATKESVWL